MYKFMHGHPSFYKCSLYSLSLQFKQIFKHLTLAVFLHFNIICMFAMHQNYKNPLEQVSAHVPVSVKFVTDKSGFVVYKISINSA